MPDHVIGKLMESRLGYDGLTGIHSFEKAVTVSDACPLLFPLCVSLLAVFVAVLFDVLRSFLHPFW